MTVAAAMPSEPRIASAPGAPGWRARLELDIESRRDKSVISRREHFGPLVVQRAFHPEPSGCCHVYLIHPPGGIVGGDQIDLTVQVGQGARALLTTPAATKLYRSAGPESRIRQIFRVHSGAALEWMPQETIAFTGCSAQLTTVVELENEAAFVGWEIVCLGRPAAGEGFDRGHFRQRFILERDGKPLLTERLSLRGSGAELRAPWGMGGHVCQGTFVAVGPRAPDADLVERVRARVSGAPGLCAVTTLGDVLLCRVLGAQGLEARQLLFRAWEAVRPELMGWPLVVPRIWAT